MTSPPPQGLARFNSAPAGAARAALREVCAGRTWIEALAARRPYAGTGALLAASDTATAALTADGLAEAMAAHPPIGRPAPGDPVSAREQRGMTGASERLRAETLELGLAYQERFGHVFLICATGLTAEQLRDAVRNRIDNPPEQEREIVRVELAKINRIRLSRLAEEYAGPSGAPDRDATTEKGTVS
ncbi:MULTISPECIES: 2-oxo-4-hydroxy-4-carboxy-5-ureidoimidazoline decarboxylase [Streptomyces]|uniref:2-oxo-4-hydroxy-4-carboxy-5-ureidoimidazoline decarboxylase n=1 Tax=Streptomyces lycii TaxID=2654337 RepID=A0ABQ7F9Q8_9ACTN|nr:MULTISPECIES: 2-oxo-4-hydroxy-4-carboxy-5-ureidoimidazoline decarboxylase [Streptomyces]KAF4405611.1 2-oxo-4-hydroxy-4-carboxy-5-ureidoimidazoline decarboxylase [Streptomyces lycii]PGH47917.1 OHCU decarboxylase [Streptomyces sp. Ru87]